MQIGHEITFRPKPAVEGTVSGSRFQTKKCRVDRKRIYGLMPAPRKARRVILYEQLSLKIVNFL